MSVAATIVVHFGDDVDEGAFAAARFDDELNVDAAGEVVTEFEPGDIIHFLVQHDPSIRISRVAATDGTIAAQPDKYYGLTEQLHFAENDEAQELALIPSGAITRTAYGRQAAGWTISGRSVKITGGAPVVYDLEYRARCRSFRLHAPNVMLAEDETWPVFIDIYLENA